MPDVLPLDHPLRKAWWIWPDGWMYLHNHYAQFRHDFGLKKVPGRAPLFITADKSYRLFVNGEYVCRGPARGYQARWPFDEVDLASVLRAGHNWISVEAYNPGISTFQYLHATAAGFLCAARWGDLELYTGDHWGFRRSAGHRTDTARYSLQMDFQEDCDLSLSGREWITSPRMPDGWDLHHTPQGKYWPTSPLGRPPWETVEPRGIPLLRHEIVTPVGATARGTGKSLPDYLTRPNLSWGWVEEGSSVRSWSDGHDVKSRTGSDWLRVNIEPAGKGRYNAVTVDVGRIVLGNLIVEIDGARGGEVLDFQHDQCLRSGRPEFLPKGEACYAAMANRLRLRPGKNAHEFYHPLCFRHVTVIARDCTVPLKLRVKVRTSEYPFEMKGAFTSSDQVLNDIHAACRRTQQLCAIDSYVDTPWREQAQWWGDARVQGRNTFYLDGDPRLFVRGIRSLSGQRTSQGLTYGHAPTIAYNCVLPDFSITWLLTLWDHYWQTGDTSLFVEQWPGVRAMLGYFHSEDGRSPNGLLRYDPRYWYFGDWAEMHREGNPTYINMWYLLAIRKIAALLESSRMKREAAELTGEARSLERAIVAKLFDRTAGLFSDGLDAKGRRVKRQSAHDQVCAILLGLKPDAHGTMIRSRVLPYLRGEKIEGAIPSAFWCTYLFEAATLHGLGAEVIAFIKQRWSPMLSTGTTWEMFDWSEKSGSTCTHAWTAHPSYHLVNILAGITQTAPGWKRVRFAPVLVKGIDHASATVPTPRGMIRAGWTREDGKVRATLELPAGVVAEVELPGTAKKVSRRPRNEYESRLL